MKRLFIIIGAVLLTTSLFAQSPQKMSYQAVIRDGDNKLVITQVGMQISILQGSESGIAVYIETQTPTPNVNGLVTIIIGEGTQVSTGAFADIDWSAGPYYIKTETATEAPLTTYTIEGTSQLLSVPYALYAKTAGTSDALQSQINMLKNSSAAGGVVSDIDNNVYNTVKIGTQIWMAENLKTTKYNDGTAIPNITDNTAWLALTTGAYCDYSNTPANSTTYGRLYNWYAIDNNAATKVASNGGKNVCPTGWHVPTYLEWIELTNYLGGLSVAGGKLKETGTTHWASPNTDATNETGFTALPGGCREEYITFGYVGSHGYWWTPSEDGEDADKLSMKSDLGNVSGDSSKKQWGYSVRCVRD